MKYIAHRGLCTKHNPENSEEAILLGTLNKSIAGVEFDVRLTKDNEVIIFHDDVIDRMAFGGTGFVNEMDLKTIQKYNIGQKTKYIMVPTLESVLSKIKVNAFLIIELKDVHEKNTLLCDKVLDIISNYPHITFYLQSFSEDIINYLIEHSTYKVGALITQKNVDRVSLDVDFYSISKNIISPNMYQNIMNANKEVMIWTVDEKKELSELRKYQEAYIISNNAVSIQKRFIIF